MEIDIWNSFLGLPLDMALARLRDLGIESPEIIETKAPRTAEREGTVRVVRAHPGRLTVSVFPDGDPVSEA